MLLCLLFQCSRVYESSSSRYETECVLVTCGSDSLPRTTHTHRDTLLHTHTHICTPPAHSSKAAHSSLQFLPWTANHNMLKTSLFSRIRFLLLVYIREAPGETCLYFTMGQGGTFLCNTESSGASLSVYIDEQTNRQIRYYIAVALPSLSV